MPKARLVSSRSGSPATLSGQAAGLALSRNEGLRVGADECSMLSTTSFCPSHVNCLTQLPMQARFVNQFTERKTWACATLVVRLQLGAGTSNGAEARNESLTLPRHCCKLVNVHTLSYLIFAMSLEGGKLLSPFHRLKKPEVLRN